MTIFGEKYIWSFKNLTLPCHRVPGHVPPAVAGQLGRVADEVDVQVRARRVRHRRARHPCFRVKCVCTLVSRAGSLITRIDLKMTGKVCPLAGERTPKGQSENEAGRAVGMSCGCSSPV